MTPDNYKEMTATQLAQYQSGWKERTHHDILAEKEWQRRFMIEQHELDKRLLAKQVKWMQVSIIVGFLGIIAGALITVLATWALQQMQQKEQIQTSIQQAQQKNEQAPLAQKTK